MTTLLKHINEVVKNNDLEKMKIYGEVDYKVSHLHLTSNDDGKIVHKRY